MSIHIFTRDNVSWHLDVTLKQIIGYEGERKFPRWQFNIGEEPEGWDNKKLYHAICQFAVACHYLRVSITYELF